MKETSLSELTETEREQACQKYKIIEPYLHGSMSLTSIAQSQSIPLRTLTIWVKKYRQSNLMGLARQSRRDKGTSRKYDETLKKAIEGICLRNIQLSSANIHRFIVEYCQQENLAIPSYRSVCRIIDNMPDDLITLSSEGTKAYQQKYDLIHRRVSEHPNDIWQSDHELIDLEILNAYQKPQRPWLTVIMDDCSRGICGYELSFLSPSAEKTSLCLRQAIWRKPDPKWQIFGIPAMLYTDHGSDYTSHHIEQVCIELKIRLIHSQIAQPKGRGKIERFFRTMNQRLISKLQEMTNVNGSTKYLDLKSLNDLIYQFIIEYNHEVHSELNDISPQERWQLNGFLPQILDSLEYLDLLLLCERKARKVMRDGIHFQGLRYIDTVLAEYVGENVMIRYTPSDITSIRVFHKGKFLCQPLCTELSQTSIGIKEIQQIRNERRRKLRKKILERKSLVEAVIDASRQSLPLFSDAETLSEKPQQKTPQLKRYKYE
jgi:putative transposase